MNDEHPWDNGIPLSEYELIEAERYGQVAFDTQLEGRIRLEDATTRKHEAERDTVLAKIELKKLEVEGRRLETENTGLRLAVLKASEAAEAANDERDEVRRQTARQHRVDIEMQRLTHSQLSEQATAHEQLEVLDRYCRDDEALNCPACQHFPTKRSSGTRWCTCCDWIEGDLPPSEPF